MEHQRETEEQTREFNQDCYVSTNLQMCRQIPIVQYNFFLLVQESAFKKSHSVHSDKIFLIWTVLALSYPKLHGIVNLIQILQGGLEIMFLSWRTLPLTDLHSPVHLCISFDVFGPLKRPKVKKPRPFLNYATDIKPKPPYKTLQNFQQKKQSCLQTDILQFSRTFQNVF